MTDFDKAASAVAGSKDPFDRAASAAVDGQRTQLRSSLYGALLANPEVAARAQQLGKQTGLPADVVERNMQDVQRRASLDKFDAVLQDSPAVAQWLSDQNNAKIAHDDVDNLGLLETMVRSFKRGVPALKSQLPALRMVDQSAGLQQLDYVDAEIAAGRTPDVAKLGAVGVSYANANPLQRQAMRKRYEPAMQEAVAQSASEFVGLQKERQAIQLPGVVDKVMGAKTFGEAFQQFGQAPAKFIASIGPESMVQSLPGLAAAVPAGFAAGPAGAAGAMGAGSFLTDYASSLVEAMQGAGIDTGSPDAIRQGLRNPEVLAKITEQAGKHAAVVGAFDALSGGLAGKTLLPKAAAAKLVGAPLAKQMANIAMQTPIQAALGAAGEAGGQIASGQDLKPGEILAEAFGEFFGTPGEVVSASAGRIREIQRGADAAQKTGERLAALEQATKASKVAQRNPDAFEQFITEVAQESPGQEFYIDSRALMQSGVAEQLAGVSPSVAEQLQEAAVTGADIRVPASEMVATILRSDLAQQVIDHTREQPGDFTPAEARDYQSKNGDVLRQEVEQILGESSGRAEADQSAESVRNAIAEQLNTLGRFDKKANGAYADMVASFYRVLGEKTGQTAEQAFQANPIRLANDGQAIGAAFNQGEAERAQARILRKRADKTEDESKAADLRKRADELDAIAQRKEDEASKAPEAIGLAKESDMRHLAPGPHNGVSIAEYSGPADPDGLRSDEAAISSLRAAFGNPDADVVVYRAAPRGSALRAGDWVSPTREYAEDHAEAVGAESIEEYVVKARDLFTDGNSVNEWGYHPGAASVFNQGARGAFNPDTRTIALLKDADLSTFLHESAHAFLEILTDVAAKDGAPQVVRDDMAALLAWFGVPDLAAWQAMSLEEKRPAHEQFAVGFEKYLFEGKAPSAELQGVFNRFRSWLLYVYKSIASLDVTLTDDVRGVFDRMLATDEQIQQAQKGRAMVSAFAGADQAGMTPDEWARHLELGREATDQAVADLQAKALGDMKWLRNAKGRELKRLQAEAAEKRAEIRSEIEAAVLAERVYRADQFLRHGDLIIPDDANRMVRRAAEQANIDGNKLSLPTLKEMYGEEANAIWRYLPTGKTGLAAKQGMHPDMVADLFGYSSGDEMVRELLAAEPIEDTIEARTDVAMLERFGELSTPDAIEREADRAIYNEARARFVSREVDAMAQATGGRRVLLSAAKEFAQALIARRKIADIRPGQFGAAAMRASRNAMAAMRKGDTATAAAEKRAELVNTLAVKEAYDAQAEVEKGLKYLRKFEGAEIRKDIGADAGDQIDAMLERFDLRKSTPIKAAAERKALSEWIAAQREAGIEPDIDQGLINEAERRPYKDLTVEEFRGLVDAARQIETIGRNARRLLTADQQKTYEEARDEIVAGVIENSRGRIADSRTPYTEMGRWAQKLRQFGAAHIKAAMVARVLDGGNDGGPVWEYLVRGANERGDMETTMRAKATEQLAAVLAPVRKLGKMGGKGVWFPSISRSLNRESRLAIALNAGNASNMQRLLDGEGWTQAQIMPVLQSLTAQEWAAVQSIWDHFEQYRPMIAEKERRVYGKEPNWIDPQPFELTAADGVVIKIKGGYYPVKYDPAASQRAEQFADAEEAKAMMQGAFTSSTTRRSFTKGRAEQVVGRPLLYNLSGVYSGVNEVIHDLAWHEWLIDANKLLRSHSIDQAIRSTYGPEYKAQLKTWVQAIAEGDKGSSDAVDAAVSVLRQNVSVGGLGFNLMSAAMQPLGLTQSIVRVGATWVGRGMAAYVANPAKASREAREKSAFMANRARTRFRELNELRNQVQDQTAAKELMGRYAYFFMMKAQAMVDVPTWHGAYEKAIAGGNDEARAVALADQAVIDSQGGGQTKDLSAIERGGPVQKLFTVFYSFMNTALNLGVGQVMTAKSKAKLAADMLLIYSVPAVFGSLLKDALTPGDDDWDEEKLARKLAADQVSYLMGMVVIGREFSEVAKIVTGDEGARDYQGPAGLRMVVDVMKFAKQSMQGEFDDAFRKAAINLLGDLFGLPSGQINKTITGSVALAEGKTDNPFAVALGYRDSK